MHKIKPLFSIVFVQNLQTCVFWKKTLRKHLTKHKFCDILLVSEGKSQNQTETKRNGTAKTTGKENENKNETTFSIKREENKMKSFLRFLAESLRLMEIYERDHYEALNKWW